MGGFGQEKLEIGKFVLTFQNYDYKSSLFSWRSHSLKLSNDPLQQLSINGYFLTLPVQSRVDGINNKLIIEREYSTFLLTFFFGCVCPVNTEK